MAFYDVLTDMIPGTTVVISAFLLYPPLLTAITISNLFWVAILIGGYVAGHFLRVVRDIGPQASDFQDRLREGETHFDETVYELLPDHFELPDVTEKSDTLFPDIPDSSVMPLVLSYLETRPAVRALRMQSMYSFYRSMTVASLVVFGMAVLSLCLKPVQAGLVSSWEKVAIVFILSGIGIPVFRLRREKFKNRFVRYTIQEYYIDRVVSQK